MTFDAGNELSKMQEQLAREREVSRRLQVDIETNAKQELSNAERLHRDVTQRSSEQAQHVETMKREILNLQGSAGETHRSNHCSEQPKKTCRRDRIGR